MPALIGSNLLECWKEELYQQYSTPAKINLVIDAWSTVDPATNIGVLQINETQKPSSNHVCTFIKCTFYMNQNHMTLKLCTHRSLGMNLRYNPRP